MSRVSWTMVDQGIVSIGSFILNIQLARHLAPSEYGTFALLLGAFLGLQLFNASLLSYPLSIQLPIASPEDRPRLIATNFVLVMGTCIPLSTVLAMALAAFGRTDLMFPVISAFALMQVQEVLRRCLLSGFRHMTATIGDAMTYLGQAALVAVLIYAGMLTLASTYWVMAVAFGAGALIQAQQLPLRAGAAGNFIETVNRYWLTGRFSLANNLISLLRLQLMPWSLALAIGAAAAAALQAAVNVINLANPIILGLCNIIPQAAASSRSTGNGAAWRSARDYAFYGAPIALGFYALVFAAPQMFLTAFYGDGSPYIAIGAVVRILAVAWATGYVTDMICSYLHGIDAARSAFDINAFGLMATAVLALPLVALWGVTGAALTIAGGNAVRLIASCQQLTRSIANERTA